MSPAGRRRSRPRRRERGVRAASGYLGRSAIAARLRGDGRCPARTGDLLLCKARAGAAVCCRLSLKQLGERWIAHICCALLQFAASKALPESLPQSGGSGSAFGEPTEAGVPGCGGLIRSVPPGASSAPSAVPSATATAPELAFVLGWLECACDVVMHGRSATPWQSPRRGRGADWTGRGLSAPGRAAPCRASMRTA